MRCKIVFLILLIILSLALFSEPPLTLTLEEAIKLAIENDHGYKISQEQIKQYRWKLYQNMNFLPQASINGFKNLKEKLMEIEMPLYPGQEPQKFTLDFTKNYEFTLQIVQPVFLGGKALLMFRVAQLDLQIAKEKERNSREETILNVKKAFFNIQILQALLLAHQEAQGMAENNYQNIKQGFELGLASRYDLLRAELALSSTKPDILRVQSFLDTANLGLKLMIGVPDTREVQLLGKMDYSPYALQEGELVHNALQNRSELRQLSLEQKKINSALKIGWAQFIPDFSIVASYSFRSDNFNFRKNNWESYYTINLGISMPIFTGFKRSAYVGEAKVMKKILEQTYEQLSDATKLQVEATYATIKQEYENIQMGEKNMETAKEGARIAELSYQEGMITILELNASLNELTRAKVQYLQALYNYNIAAAELEKITRTQFTGGNK